MSGNTNPVGYCVVDYNEGETPNVLNTVFSLDAEHEEWIAEEAAEDFHDHHDGWEFTWPITVILMKPDGTEFGRYEVELEHRPTFYAGRIEPKTETVPT